MHLLLTNDDGIEAPGLAALASALAALGQVWVVAPEGERSACSHSITLKRQVAVRRLGAGSPPRWAVSGTPADCVKIAVEALLPVRPHLVVAGINRGANLGADVLYSGTVAAALEGAMQGLPALAVSLVGEEGRHLATAGQWADRLCRLLLSQGSRPRAVWNVNLPDRPAQEVTGLSFTRLGRRRYRNAVTRVAGPENLEYYLVQGEPVDGEEEEGTDVAAVQRGYVSVTPLHFDLTDYACLRGLTEAAPDQG